MSIAIVCILLLGVAIGFVIPTHISTQIANFPTIIMMALLFSIGIDMGNNKTLFHQMRRMGSRILIAPFGVVAGSLFGGLLAALIFGEEIHLGFAIVSGMGWYSMSGVIISEAGYPLQGTISFLSNVIREVLTFVLIPILARRINYYAPIALAGTASMDIALGYIHHNTDDETAMIAFASGTICSMLVPVLVPLFL